MIDVMQTFSQGEQEMMNWWVEAHANGSGPRTNFIKILADNYAEPKESLYNIFGKNFILSKKIQMKIPEPELQDQMWTAIANLPFIDAIREKYNKAHWGTPEAYFWGAAFSLTGSCVLVSNEYNGEDRELNSPKTGKPLKIQFGCKPVKMLGKIAEAFDLDGFEEFRLAHSRVLNQAKTFGELCLSIHPMDYMTMSDNGCDWSSCMSWRECGCYRRGTVEMMTSPLMVVAYLKSSSDFYFGPWNERNKFSWNSKKWRTLLILDKDAIVSIKGYPYQSEELTSVAISWLAELCNTNGDYNFNLSEKPAKTRYTGSVLETPKERTLIYNTEFITNSMYNDFGTCVHYVLTSQNYSNYQHKVTNYSGEAICVWCGDREVTGSENEECLVCVNCGGSDGYWECECGAEVSSEDDFIWVGGNRYCESCFGEFCFTEPLTGEYYEYDNYDAKEVYLVKDKFDYNKIDQYESTWTIGYYLEHGCYGYPPIPYEYDEENGCYFIKGANQPSEVIKGIKTLFYLDSARFERYMSEEFD